MLAHRGWREAPPPNAAPSEPLTLRSKNPVDEPDEGRAPIIQAPREPRDQRNGLVAAADGDIDLHNRPGQTRRSALGWRTFSTSFSMPARNIAVYWR